MGEFGLQEILKQFLGEDRASLLSPAWAGDRYAVFEDATTKNFPLVFRLVLDNEDDAARFFGQYSEALELKYKTRKELYRRPNFFQFQTDSGGIFLRCVASMCLVLEGAPRETYDKLNAAVGWTPAPSPLFRFPCFYRAARNGRGVAAKFSRINSHYLTERQYYL